MKVAIYLLNFQQFVQNQAKVNIAHQINKHQRTDFLQINQKKNGDACAHTKWKTNAQLFRM